MIEKPKNQETGSEVLVAAAIKHKGVVYKARNHGEAYEKLVESGVTIDNTDVQDGFLTNKDRFVEQEEAQKISGLEGPITSDDI